MTKPILFLVDGDTAALEALAATLERRYSADYRILIDGSSASALARIQEECERGEKVALVVAGVWSSGAGGPGGLGRVPGPCPPARPRGPRYLRGRAPKPGLPRAPPLGPGGTQPHAPL